MALPRCVVTMPASVRCKVGSGIRSYGLADSWPPLVEALQGKLVAANALGKVQPTS